MTVGRREPPGEEIRHPGRGSKSFAVREPLARWLEQEGRSAAGLRVLDVGCGKKPYLPYFSTAAEYVGLDVVPNPFAELQGPVEELPVPDASFDLVLCIQVLEHADDPARAVRELHRVTRPGGRVLASTHGTQPYHPSPADYWRWTHTGLARLFETNGDWRSVSVTPGAGTASCVAMLLANYVHLAFKQLHLPRLATLINAPLNTFGAALDRRSTMLSEAVPGSLIANFHVVAQR